jgi:tryptophan-rich sensory protein
MSTNLASLSDPNRGVLPAASSDTQVDSCGSMTLKGQLCNKGLWVYIIVAIIVLVVCMYITRSGMKKDENGESWWDKLAKNDWGVSGSFWGILLVVGVILFAWASFTALQTPGLSDQKRYLIIGGFGVSMLSLVAMFSVLFSAEKNKNEPEAFSRASWMAIFAAVIGFALLYPMWGCNTARVAMIPYLVWVTAMAVMVWRMSTHYNDASEGNVSRDSHRHSGHGHAHGAHGNSD